METRTNLDHWVDQRTTNLDKWLYLVRRTEEHREDKAVKDLQKLYKKLIKTLRSSMGNIYADYADPETGSLDYGRLHRTGLDARLLEEVAANVNAVTQEECRIIMETVEQTYANCFSGMVQAVEQAVDNDELHAVFAAVDAVKPEVLKAAVNNPVHGLTLSDQLEKNRADIVWGIKQAVGVGLSQGDRYDTMARRIQKELIGDDGSGGSYAKSVRIARTEAHRVREEGNLDAAQNLTERLEPEGVTMVKTWHTMKDERVRPNRARKTKGGWKYSKGGKYDHVAMEGVQVPVKEEFELPSGATAQAPGKSGVAGEDINCRCFLSYDIIREDGYNLQTSQNSNIIKPLKISSIESRTHPTGIPVGIAISGDPLNARQKRILERLQNYDDRFVFNKRDVSMKDLAALTAHENVEFAMFTKNGKRLVIRGERNSVNVLPEDARILAEEGYRWSGHTHPGMDYYTSSPSPGDRAVLAEMNQRFSVIYSSTGRKYIFAVDDKNDIGHKS